MAEHRENGRRSRGDDNLSGCYLLIVVAEPTTAEHREVILQKITKGFLSWDMEATGCCISAELQYLVDQDPIPEEAKNGEKLIQFVSENLVTEVLINPLVNTLQQCMKNLLSSYTKHKHVIHSGYAFSGSGSWILQDSTYSFADFLDAFQDAEVQRIFKAYENCISIHIHCAPEGDWTTMQLNKESFAKLVKVAINPDDRLSKLNGVANFVSFLQRYIIAQPLVDLLEPSDVVGNIRFSRPTLYVFPGGQGDSALFGVNGFNMLIDGGFNRKACFWDFARHLDRVDALLVTQISNSNLNGVSSFLKRKVMGQVYPKIGHVFCNIMDRKHSPDGDKDTDSLLVSLAEEGHLMMENLRHLGLKPQNCYRESAVEPINLYHKVGHGNLDMFVLNPAKDSKEVKEFLQQWHSQSSAFGASRIGMKIADKELLFPLPNLMSICAILVWQPADPTDSITRILFPGSSPQSKIFEGLDKLRHLEILKAPVCSEKSLQSTSITKLKSKSQVGDIKPIRLSAAKLAAVNKSEEKPEIISKAQPPKIERKHELKATGKIDEKKATEVKPMPKLEDKKSETKALSKPDTKKQEAKKSSPVIAPPEKKAESKKVVHMVGGKLIEMPKTMNGSGKGGPTRHMPADNGKSVPKAKGVKEATNKKAAEEKNIAMRASATAKKETVKKAATKKPTSGSVRQTSATLSTSKTATETASPTPSDLENKKVSSSSATSVASSVDTNMLDNKTETPALVDEISPTNEGDIHLAAQDSAEEEKTSVDEKQSLDEEVQAEKDSIKLAKEEFLTEEATEKEKITDAITLEDKESNEKISSSLSTSEQSSIEVSSKNETVLAITTELDETIVDGNIEAQLENVQSKFIIPEKEEALVEPENVIDETPAERVTSEDEKESKFEISCKPLEMTTKQLEFESAAVQAEDAGLLLAKEIKALPVTQVPETELQESRNEKLDFQEQDVFRNKETFDEPLVTPLAAGEMHAIDKVQDLQSHEQPSSDVHDVTAQQLVEDATVTEAFAKYSKEYDSKVEKFVEDITQTAIKAVVSEPEDLQTEKSPTEDLQFKDLKDDFDVEAQNRHVDDVTSTKGSENVFPISKSPEVKDDLQLEPDFDFAPIHPTQSWQKQHVDGWDRPKEDAGETFLDPSKVHIIFTAASSEEATDEYKLDEKASIESAKVEQVSPAKDSKDVEPLHIKQSTDEELKETVHDDHEQHVFVGKIAPDLIAEVPSLETDSKILESTLSYEHSPVLLPSHEAKVEVPVVEQETYKREATDGPFREDLKESVERQESKESIPESGSKGPEEKLPPSSPVEKYVDHGRIPIAEETGSKLTGLVDKDFKAAVILSPIPEDAPKLTKLDDTAGPLTSGEVQREVRLQQESQECLRTPDEVADLPIHEEVPTEFEGYYQIRGPLHGIPETLAEHDDIPPHLRSAFSSSQTAEKELEKSEEEKMEESVYMGTLNADHAEVVTLSNGTSPSTPLSPKSPKDKETKEVENIFIHPSSGSVAIGKLSCDEGITHFKEAQEMEESSAFVGKIEHSAGFEIKKEKLAETLYQDEKGLEDSKEKIDIEKGLEQKAKQEQTDEDHVVSTQKILSDEHLTKDANHPDKDRISLITKDSQVVDINSTADSDIKEKKLRNDDEKDLVGTSSTVTQEEQRMTTQPDVTYVKESAQDQTESPIKMLDFKADQRIVHDKESVQSDQSDFRTDQGVDYVEDAFPDKSIESQIERSSYKTDKGFFQITDSVQDRAEIQAGISDFGVGQEIDHAKDNVPDKRESQSEQSVDQVDHSTFSNQIDLKIDHAKDSLQGKLEEKIEQSDFRADQEIAREAVFVPEKRDSKIKEFDFKTDYEMLSKKDSVQEKPKSQIEEFYIKEDKELASKVDIVTGKQDDRIEQIDSKTEPEMSRLNGDMQDKPREPIELSDIRAEMHAQVFVRAEKKDEIESDLKVARAKDVSDTPKGQAHQPDFVSLEVSKDVADSGPDAHHISEFHSTSPLSHEFDSRSSPLLESMLLSKAPVDLMTQSFYDETTATHEESSKTMDPMTQSFYDSTTATKDESSDAKDVHAGYFVLPAESQIPFSLSKPDDFMKNGSETKVHKDGAMESEIRGQLHDAKAMDDFASTHTKHEERYLEEGAMRSSAPLDSIDMDAKHEIKDSNIVKRDLDCDTTLVKERASHLEDTLKDSLTKDNAPASKAGQADKVDILPQVYDAGKEYEGYYEVHVPPEYGFVAPEVGTKQSSPFAMNPEEPIQLKKSGFDVLSETEPKPIVEKSEQTVQEAAHEPLKEIAALSLKESISLDEKDKEELVDEYQCSSPYYQDSYSPEAGFQGDSPLPPAHGQQSPTYPQPSYSPDLGEVNNGRQRSETFVGDPYDEHRLPPEEEFSLQKHVSAMEQSFHGEFPQSAYFSDKYDAPSPQQYPQSGGADDEDGMRPTNDQFKTLPDTALSPMHSGSYVSADEDTEDEFRGQHYDDKQSDADSESPYHRPDLQVHLLREKVAYHDPMGTDSSDDSDVDVVRKRHGRPDRYYDPSEHQQRRVDVHVQGGDAAGKFGGGLGSYWEQEQPYEEHKRRSPVNAAHEHTVVVQGGQYPKESDTWDPSRGLATQDFDPRSTPDYAAYHPTAYQPGPSSSDSEPQTSPELSPKGFEMDSPEVRHTPFKFGKQRFGEEKHYREGPESPFPASGGASLSSPSTEERSVQEDKKDKPASKNPFDDWGEPMGLPSPPPPADEADKMKNKPKSKPGGKAMEPKKQHQQLVSSSLKKNSPKVNGKSEDGENKKESATKPYEKSSKKAPPPTASPKRVPPSVSKSSPAKTKRPDSPMSVGDGRKSAANKASGIPPVYVDLTYIPHHGNPFYCDVEFFRTIRARYYVFSGTNPSKEVFNALLEAKQSWENPDLEVTIIPTYDTDTLGYWFALNEDELAKNKIDLAPSASRCTINLQDHETSCSAYRLEF